MRFKLHHTLWWYCGVLLLVAAFSPFPPESSHKCYFIDGSFDPDGGPCYGNVGASMCCYRGEDCYPNSALCLASQHGPLGSYDNGSSIWRRSCTDADWQDPACLAIAYGKSSLSVFVEELERMIVARDQWADNKCYTLGGGFRRRRRIRATEQLFGWNPLPANGRRHQYHLL